MAVANTEAVIDEFDGSATPFAQDHFLEMLEYEFIEFAQLQHVDIVVVHEPLDCQLPAAVFVPEALRQFALMVEQQAVFAAPRNRVQAPADPRNEALGIVQRDEFTRREEALAQKILELRGAVVALRDPADELQIAQASWTAFHVGLEVVLRVVVATIAASLLLALGSEEVCGRPHLVCCYGFVHGKAKALGPHDRARLHQIGDNREVGLGFLRALFRRSHGMADFEAEVPQAGDEARYCELELGFLGDGAVEQHENVDIGVGLEFAAAVATHGEKSGADRAGR